MRDMRVRLTEYSTSLRSVADQITAVAEKVESVRQDVNPETQGLRDSATLYRLIAGDLDTILRGEELKGFIITGEVTS